MKGEAIFFPLNDNKNDTNNNNSISKRMRKGELELFFLPVSSLSVFFVYNLFKCDTQWKQPPLSTLNR